MELILFMGSLVCNSICTLAVGEKYSLTASQLMLSLSSGVRKYCLTDNINLDFGGAKVIKFQDDFTPIWQQKRHIIKEAVNNVEDTIFIDADYQYLGTSHVISSRPPGVYSWKIDPMQSQIVWHEKTLVPVMDGLSRVLNIKDWKKAVWVAPNLFQVKAGSSTPGFFDAWNQISFYLRDNKYKINDGISIGLAAYVSGYTPKEDPDLFHLHKGLKHLFFGNWISDGSMT